MREPGFSIDPFDEDNYEAAELAEAAYGPESIHQASRHPDVSKDPFADTTRGQYPGFPFKPEPGALDQQDKARLQYLAGLFTHIIRNTNITAALPAHVNPTVWSDPIDLSSRVSIPAAAAAPGVWQDIITYILPEGRQARFVSYGYEVDDPAYTYTGSIEFRVVKNNSPVTNLENFVEQRGSPVQPRETIITADDPGTVIKFQARRAVAAAGAQDLVAALVGWQWTPRRDVEGTRGSITAY